MAEQSQGTEYTLQGVMRFLQIEWHNHERARNAWDIERAEMKAKIAKQEGDSRALKRLNELLDKQIKMLEKALKHERAKNKAIAAGEKPPSEEDVKKEWGGKIGIKRDASGASKVEGLDSAPEMSEEQERDAQRDKSKQFLQKCVEELSYLLTPPAHPPPPPPPQADPLNAPHPNDYHMSQDIPIVNADIRYQQQMQPLPPSQPSRFSHTGVSQLPSMPNTRPPPTRSSFDVYDQTRPMHGQPHQNAAMARHQPGQRSVPHGAPRAVVKELSQAKGMPLRPAEDEVEQVTHTFDSFGRPLLTAEYTDHNRPLMADENDQWNFDEQGPIIEPSPEIQRPQNLDAEVFPNAKVMGSKSPPRHGLAPHRRRSSGANGIVRRRSDGSHEARDQKNEQSNFKVRFALRGHLDVIRAVIFTGGGSPSEPEVCTASDDGTIKRWIIPANYIESGGHAIPDLDIQSYFTHRGHDGVVTSLAACPASASFSTGGRAMGDGWIFSGGQDATVKVWERGRVDEKAVLEGHTDAVWTVCVLPSTTNSRYGQDLSGSSDSPLNTSNGASDRILLASGSADHTIKIWAVSAPPNLSSPSHASGGSRRGVGGTRRHSLSSGSGFPSSPQPSTASGTPFHYSLLHSIQWPRGPAASPTCISPLGSSGENFVVSYADSSILIFDTRTGEEVIGMASSETYDGTPATGVNSVVVVSNNAVGGLDTGSKSHGHEHGRRDSGEEEGVVHGATGNAKAGGVEGVIISGHEDRYVRFFDANSGQCTYNMLAHPASIAALSLSPDGRELVSAGHDASVRFWSLEKRSCTQELTSHRPMRGEGVVCVVWSQDGRWVLSGGGDGVVKVFSR